MYQNGDVSMKSMKKMKHKREFLVTVEADSDFGFDVVCDTVEKTLVAISMHYSKFKSRRLVISEVCQYGKQQISRPITG